MASSRSRETARASSKLATLTHAISNTSVTAPRSNHSVDRTSPTGGRSTSATKLRFLLVSGYCWANRNPMVAISARAWPNVALGRSRAITPTGWIPRFCMYPSVF